CISLTNIVIPSSVTNLADYAFHNCVSLSAAYFRGNPPGIGLTAFGGYSPNTVYYLPGRTGWGPTFDGRPTAPWLLRIVTSDSNFGVRTNRFGFNVGL